MQGVQQSAGRRPMPALQLCCPPDHRVLVADPAQFAWMIKYDGWRAVADVDHERGTRLWSRHGTRLDAAFPEVIEQLEAVLPTGAVVDGELVCLDATGRPDFHSLGARAGCGPAAAVRAARRRPAALVVFDLLRLPSAPTGVDGVDADDLRVRPWAQRRRLLEGLALPEQLVPGRPAVFAAAVSDDGAGLLAATDALRLEGVVAARRSALYLPGRSGGWMKIKHSAHARDLQGDGRRWRRSA